VAFDEARSRQRLLHRVAGMIPAATGDDCVRVAVDGVDAAGKTIFADELAESLRALDRPVLRISADDFLNPSPSSAVSGHTTVC
jgi:hypothetical protein